MDKCAFTKTKIDFLGHIVENGKICPGKQKTVAVEKFPTPKSVVQSFLGLAGYFRNFIPSYVQIPKPLTELLEKDVFFKIKAENLNSIHQLKTVLTKNLFYELITDMSTRSCILMPQKRVFGVALPQKPENEFHSVMFWRKQFSPQECRLYSYIHT